MLALMASLAARFLARPALTFWGKEKIGEQNKA
jgi:hypothetical protein